MGELVLGSLYLFLPAYAANMAPVVAKRAGVLPALARPLDGGRIYRGHPLLGAHKTWRGILTGLAAAIVVAFLQQLGARRNAFLASLSAPPHEEYSPLVWGGALGLGALLGDLGKSFVKRRRGIPPGQRWLPWDQLDLVVGALLAGRLFYPFSWSMVLVVLVVTPLLGLLINLAGYMLSVKEAW